MQAPNNTTKTDNIITATTKTLEFLERTDIDDILDNDDFFRKLEDLK